MRDEVSTFKLVWDTTETIRVLLLLALWSLTCCRSESKDESKVVPVEPQPFRVTKFRTGNSLTGYKAALKRGVRYAESDFILTADGVLVSTHDNRMGGTCGEASRMTMREIRNCRLEDNSQVATLKDFLEMPFEEHFIDLKNSALKKNRIVIRSVVAAVEEIRAQSKERQAVLMLYRIPKTAMKVIEKNNIRAGLKGYPESAKNTLAIVRKAAQKKAEMVCVNIKFITPEILKKSAQMGIWHLAWDMGEDVERWKYLAKFGLGGIITRNIAAAEKIAARPR